MKRKGVLGQNEGLAGWDAVQAILVDLRPVDIRRAALRLAARFGIHAYDACFLECALGLRVPILTLDKQMKRVARQLGIPVLAWEK